MKLSRINSLIKILTYSDLLIISGWGLVNPIFAVYLSTKIKNGNLELAGLAMAVFYITKSFLQIPVARFIDSIKGELDDMITMAVGTCIISIVPFLYAQVSTAAQVLLLQAFYGIGYALVTPGWLAIFTRHLDRHQEAEEWSVYNSMTSLGAALAGALGGFIAEKFGFQVLFLAVGIICIAGTSLLYFVYQDLRQEEKEGVMEKLLHTDH